MIDPFSCKRCSCCGLRWLSPRPTQDGYQLIYTMDNYFGDGELSPEKFSSLEKNRKLLFRDRLKKISGYCSTTHRQKTILDVGAATGQFVYEAKRMDYNAIGIELSHEAREEARRRYSVELYENTLEDFFSQGYRFDIIHMNHVFEHILHPDRCLQECNRLLKENGLLLIEVPQQFYNDIDRLKKILLIKKRPFFTPYSLHHTYFYTPKTLTLLLRKYNFLNCRLKTANLANTPLYPLNFRNSILAIYLFISDKIHRGGNIIEVFARKEYSL